MSSAGSTESGSCSSTTEGSIQSRSRRERPSCAAHSAAGPRIVEQHVLTRGTDRFDALDLLCSGFHAETAVA